MNQYAVMAQEHWQRYRPRATQELENPTQFFTELGEEAARQVQETAAKLAGPDRPGETYQAKRGRLNMARLMAEEQVLPEVVLLPVEDDETAETAIDPASSTATQTGTDAEGWIPIQEDPEHPFWQQHAEDEQELRSQHNQQP